MANKVNLFYTGSVMAISKEEVKHIAELARLELTEIEAEKFQGELSSILKYIDKLQKVDTKGVEPTFQTTNLVNIFRDDVVQKERVFSQKEVLSNAPRKQAGYIKVKPVF